MVLVIDGGREPSAYHHFLLTAQGHVYRVENAGCQAVAEHAACLAEYGEEWCIKYLGAIKYLYCGKDTEIDLNKVYKKYRAIVKKAIV